MKYFLTFDQLDDETWTTNSIKEDMKMTFVGRRTPYTFMTTTRLQISSTFCLGC